MQRSNGVAALVLILLVGVSIGAGARDRVLSSRSSSSSSSTESAPIALGPAECHARAGGALPDPACTPGALNPAVTPATLAATICRHGYTATIRPASSVTGPEKRASMVRYGEGSSSPSLFEFDHLISLELGGAANDPRNLWPEPHVVNGPAGDEGSFAKDRIENALRRRVCAGTLSLLEAQRTIATDWRDALRSSG